jgi:hypothetical protein
MLPNMAAMWSHPFALDPPRRVAPYSEESVMAYRHPHSPECAARGY